MPSLALNKILLASANSNATASYFIAGSTGLTSGANSVLSAGSYVFYPVANVAVQVNNKSDGTGFTTVLANNTGGFMIADGTNVRITNLGNQLATSTYVVVGSEIAAPDTFGNV
jgi:hypothetical protein